MKTIVGLVWGIIAGFFVGYGVIVFLQLIGAGADLLGFTKWTLRYYVICLVVCITLLLISKHVRKHGAFMGLFLVAVSMVIGIGFNSVLDGSSGGGPIERIQDDLLSIALIMAKAVMYVAPGGLTAFYIFIAFNGVSQPRAKVTTDLEKS